MYVYVLLFDSNGNAANVLIVGLGLLHRRIESNNILKCISKHMRFILRNVAIREVGKKLVQTFAEIFLFGHLKR